MYYYGARAIVTINTAEYLWIETTTKVSSEPLSWKPPWKEVASHVVILSIVSRPEGRIRLFEHNTNSWASSSESIEHLKQKCLICFIYHGRV